MGGRAGRIIRERADSMNEPSPWGDMLSDAYAVLSLLGVGGYLVAMLAL